MPRCPRWAVGFPPSLEGSGGQGRCCLRVLRTAGGDAHAGAESWLQPSALVPPEPGVGRACRAPVGRPMTAGGAGGGRQTPSHGLCAHWVLYPPRSPRRWRSRAFPRFPVEGPAARTSGPGAQACGRSPRGLLGRSCPTDRKMLLFIPRVSFCLYVLLDRLENVRRSASKQNSSTAIAKNTRRPVGTEWTSMSETQGGAASWTAEPIERWRNRRS